MHINRQFLEKRFAKISYLGKYPKKYKNVEKISVWDKILFGKGCIWVFVRLGNNGLGKIHLGKYPTVVKIYDMISSVNR